MHFPVSGIDVNPIIPLGVSFIISFFTSMGGVSGSFLLLPFQISILGYTSPGASSTNLLYNILAVPGGIYRYIREGRMAWPLAWLIIAGTLPGIFIGVIIRVRYLSDIQDFKYFVGAVLLYLASRMLYDLTPLAGKKILKACALERGFQKRANQVPAENGNSDEKRGLIRTVNISWRRYTYEFYGETFSLNIIRLSLFTFFIGILGGAYGIGGAAIVAPFLLTFFGLPVYTIAGATLTANFITSIAGVLFYSLTAPYYENAGISIYPDWGLGILLGLGGFMGIYSGAVTQRYFPARLIKVTLAIVSMLLALEYLFNFY
jgi:uncharacterized protein